MQFKDYIIVALLIVVICLSAGFYVLLTANFFVDSPVQPQSYNGAQTSPSPTMHPTSISEPAPAQTSAISVPKPSVPEFTLVYVNDSRYIPPTYGIDPLTGESIIKETGYFSQNLRFIITVKNQPFTPQVDATGNVTSLFYNFRLKGHFENDSYWKNGYYLGTEYFNASNSDQTTISDSLNVYISGGIPVNSQIDFQVQALIGHIDVSQRPIYFFGFGLVNDYSFVGESSDWSPIQTLFIS